MIRLAWELAVSLALLACSSGGSSGAAGTGGGASGSGGTAASGGGSGGSSAGSGGAGSGGTSGSGASGGVGGSAGSSAGGGSAGQGGSAGACAGTPGTVKCGDGICDLKTQYCCGGPEAGKCFALGAFCGAGGGIKMFCDDDADCDAGQVCCVGENAPPGSDDSQYKSECVTPDTNSSVWGCGTTAGGMDWSVLCSCSSECVVGDCKIGTISTSIYDTGYGTCAL